MLDWCDHIINRTLVDWDEIWTDFQFWGVTDNDYRDRSKFLLLPASEVLEFHGRLQRKHAQQANLEASATAKGFSAIAQSLGGSKVTAAEFLPFDSELLDPNSEKSQLIKELDIASCHAFNVLLKNDLLPLHVEKALRQNKALWNVLINYERYYKGS